MRYKDLDKDIYKNDEVTVTLYDKGRFNLHHGKSVFTDRECICFEFEIRHTADPKKRLTRKWLDNVMKDGVLAKVLYNQVFGYAENKDVEIEESNNWSYCWADYYAVISGNRLVVVVSYKDKQELQAIAKVFRSTNRWCL